jgi:hypothetical protein
MERFSVTTRQGPVSLLCDAKLKPLTGGLLSQIREIDAQGSQFRDGMTFLNGWCVYTMRGQPGAWRIFEPNFSRNPGSPEREDCTFSLQVLAQQLTLAEECGLKPSQLEQVSCWDMVIHGGCLEDRRITTQRLGPRNGQDSGWFVGSRDRKITEEDHRVSDIATIAVVRPGLLPLFLLPVKYASWLDANAIQLIIDANDRTVWQPKKRFSLFGRS